MAMSFELVWALFVRLTVPWCLSFSGAIFLFPLIQSSRAVSITPQCEVNFQKNYGNGGVVLPVNECSWHSFFQLRNFKNTESYLHFFINYFVVIFVLFLI